jgi:hypothetical protein
MAYAAKGYGARQEPKASASSESDLMAITIRLERTACFGSCPAYSIVIHGDGQVQYDGKTHVKVTGAHEGRIETEKFSGLVAKFEEAKFESIPEDYSGSGPNCKVVCTDMPTATTEFTVNDKSHRVKHYHGCGGAPKTLFELELAVDKAADSQQWTGDMTHSGPYGMTCFGPKKSPNR